MYRLIDHYNLGPELEILEDYRLSIKSLIRMDPLFSIPCSFLNQFEAIVRDTNPESATGQARYGPPMMNAGWVSAILTKVKDQPEILSITAAKAIDLSYLSPSIPGAILAS